MAKTRDNYSKQSLFVTANRSRRKGADPLALDDRVKRAKRRLTENKKNFRLKEFSGAPLSETERARLKRSLEKLEAELESAREAVLHEAQDELATELKSAKITWGITQKGQKRGKSIYLRKSSAKLALLDAHLRFMLADSMKTRMPSRRESIEAIHSYLDGKHELYIIRADISSFFESLDGKLIKSKLKQDSSIDELSKVAIRKLLREYYEVSGAKIGTPRGVGVSSAIAEYYIRDLDRKLQNTPGLLHYTRYVDDILIICEGPSQRDAILASLRATLGELNLDLNPHRTGVITAKENENFVPELEFLGYSFSRHGSRNARVSLELSLTRLERVLARLDRSFTAWDAKRSTSDSHRSRSLDGLLLQRIKFLTGNTRLLGPKQRSLIGSFHSNAELALDPSVSLSLVKLDAELERLITLHKRKMPKKLLARLESHNFTDGHLDRKFFKFKSDELARITSAWKDLS